MADRRSHATRPCKPIETFERGEPCGPELRAHAWAPDPFLNPRAHCLPGTHRANCFAIQLSLPGPGHPPSLSITSPGVPPQGTGSLSLTGPQTRAFLSWSREHHPANRRFAIETRREAAGSTKVRQGEATTYQGWYLRVLIAPAAPAIVGVPSAIARAGPGPHAALILMAVLAAIPVMLMIPVSISVAIPASFELVRTAARIAPVIRRRHDTTGQRQSSRSQCK